MTASSCGASCRSTSTAALAVFFQAEDGIRDLTVTGVQTCALPILTGSLPRRQPLAHLEAGWYQKQSRRYRREDPVRQSVQPHDDGGGLRLLQFRRRPLRKIGRASCREKGRGAGGEIGAGAEARWSE